MTECCFDGQRMAHTLAKKDPEAEIAVFLVADAVLCAKAGQKTTRWPLHLEPMLLRILSAEGRLLMYSTRMDVLYRDDDDMMEGQTRANMDDLAQATLAADKALVF